MAIGGSFSKPGMGGGAMAPLPFGGVQGIQQQAQSNVPYQGMFNGNPGGANNMGSPPSWQQQQNLGRYVPPTMTGGNGQWNTNQWNNSGGYNYNLPGSYGSPQGGGQFAPMPGQFQQYMQPNMLSGNTFGFGSQFGPQFQQMYQQFYGGMGQNYLGGQQEHFRDMERQRAIQEFGQGMGPMAPDKVGRPFPSRTNFRGRGSDEGGPAPMPAYDNPANRQYNMNALYQMMGGF